MDFWEAQAGERRPTDDFVRGFVTSCNEVYEEVDDATFLRRSEELSEQIQAEMREAGDR
jgi:hypothetical protein